MFYTLTDWFLSSQKQELQSAILRPRLVLAKQPVKTELRQNFWSDLSGQRASPERKLNSKSGKISLYVCVGELGQQCCMLYWSLLLTAH